jgi:hypothetical protein
MQPLLVAGAIGELLDHRLVDDDPMRKAELLASHAKEFFEGRRRLGHKFPLARFPSMHLGHLSSNLEGQRQLEKRCRLTVGSPAAATLRRIQCSKSCRAVNHGDYLTRKVTRASQKDHAGKIETGA